MKTLVNGVCLVFLKRESFLNFKRNKKNRKWKKKGWGVGEKMGIKTRRKMLSNSVNICYYFFIAKSQSIGKYVRIR